MVLRKNKTKRTYTVKINGMVYKASEMSKVEFEEAYYHTESDWLTYFRNTL